MRDLVSRYSGPPYFVKYWEFWNEPDVDPSLSSNLTFGCWGDAQDPYYGGAYYAEMLKAVYPELKSADPQAQVLVGGLLLSCDPRQPSICTPPYDRPPKFLEGILRGGGGPYFDGVAFHAYDEYENSLGIWGNGRWGTTWATTGPVVIAKGRFLRETLARYGFSNKYLMVTEAALNQREAQCNQDCELSKAYYIPQLYAATLAEDYRANIWYCLSCGWRHVDLLDGAGRPLPAYTSLKIAGQALSNARFLREVPHPGGVRIYEFQRADDLLWVLWALDGSTHTVQIPGKPLSVTDPLGVSQPAGSRTISVTLKPLYVTWTP
jgi:hypothetical protein